MGDYRDVNRANWDERVPAHVASPDYHVAQFEEDPSYLSEVVRFDQPRLGDVAGLRAVHLQCHIGTDTVSLARLGARMSGLDFSPAAIEQAQSLADRLGLSVDFHVADVYDAVEALGAASYDLVFTGIGALCWLPDIRRWAAIVASFLKPGGWLYYADAHPAAYVFDDDDKLADGRPGYFMPYLGRQPLVLVDHRDYADSSARLANATHVEWLHPLSDTIGGLIEAGLTLDWLHEHAQVPWRMFQMLVQKKDGDWHWPDKPWLPLSLSLQATRR